MNVRGLNERSASPAKESPLSIRESEALEKLKGVAHSFEALLLQMVTKGMRASIPENPFFGKSFANGVFTQMFDQTMTDQAARRGRGYGIADAFVKRYKAHVLGTAASDPKKDKSVNVKG